MDKVKEIKKTENREEKSKEKSVKERLQKDNELLRIAEMYDWYEIS